MSYPVATRDAYPPELMELMSAAFDAACGRLLGEPSQAYQPQVPAAKAGERDSERLVGVALKAVVPLAADPSTAA